MWWHGGFHFGFIIFPVLIMVLILSRIVGFRRCARFRSGWYEAEALLRRRLVNGEIDEAEYLRLKAILSK